MTPPPGPVSPNLHTALRSQVLGTAKLHARAGASVVVVVGLVVGGTVKLTRCTSHERAGRILGVRLSSFHSLPDL